MRLSLQTRLAIAFGFALLSIVSLGLLQYRNFLQLTEDNRLVSHSYEVLRELEALRNSLNRADAFAQSFVITGENTYLTPFSHAVDSMDKHLQRLELLTDQNKPQHQHLDEARQFAKRSIGTLQDEVAAKKGGNLSESELLRLEKSIRTATTDLRNAIGHMETGETELLGRNREALAKSHRRSAALILAGTITTFVLLAAAAIGLYRGMKERMEAEGSRGRALQALETAKVELERQVGEKTCAEARLRESEQSLRELSLNLLRTQDEERRRIGRELHDSVGQYLAALKMSLDSAAMALKREKSRAEEHLAESRSLADESIREVRTVSYLLHPPMLEELGLQSAMSWYVEGFSKRSGLQVAIDVSADFGRLPYDVELAMFRVLQESLTNVHRHSGSPKAEVHLRMRPEEVTLEIIDHGKGMAEGNPTRATDAQPQAGGRVSVGLQGMTERMRQLGGTLQLESTATGTTVRAIVPCRVSAAAKTASASA